MNNQKLKIDIFYVCFIICSNVSDLIVVAVVVGVEAATLIVLLIIDVKEIVRIIAPV